MTEGPVTSLFDIAIARGDLYQSYVVPELFPNERPARVDNWPAEDREAYCGGEYTRVG